MEISKIEGEFEAEPKEKPRVLLYHTHSYEAFAQDPDNPYEETTQWRSADADFNIMAVGAKLEEELEARGIEVVHDRTEARAAQASHGLHPLPGDAGEVPGGRGGVRHGPGHPPRRGPAPGTRTPRA